MKRTCRKMSAKFLAVFLCLVSAVGLNNGACAELPITGFYSIKVGDVEVVALSDGTNQRSIEQQLQLLQGDKELIKALLFRAYPDGKILTAVNAYLINTGSKLVLVDAGNGKMGSPTMGSVIRNLRATGFQPEKIDEVYLTHMHGDHVGGLVFGTERAFPNATIYANKKEADFWLSEGNLNAAPPDSKRFYQSAKAAITPYINAGKFKTFDGNAALFPAIKAESLVGHTPGHTGYLIESKGETLILWGDIIHVAAVQFADPTVTISFDSDNEEAVIARQRVLTEAAKKNWLIGGVHISFPGFGYVRATDGNGYTFVPLDNNKK